MDKDEPNEWVLAIGLTHIGYVMHQLVMSFVGRYCVLIDRIYDGAVW